MRYVKSAIRSIVRVPLMRSALQRRPALIVPLYHAVDPDPPAFMARMQIVTHPAEFEEHLLWFRENFAIAPLAEAIQLLRTGALKRSTVAITFNDGLESWDRHARPLLREYDIPCTVFVNAATLRVGYVWQYAVAWLEQQGRRDVLEECFGPCDGDYLHELRWNANASCWRRGAARLVTHAAIREMPLLHVSLVRWSALQDDPLIEIGNHGMDHARFSLLDADEQSRQILDSARMLGEFRNYRRLFAVPFGKQCDWNLKTVAAAAAAEHEFVTAQGGVNPRGHAGVDIRRLPCDGLPAAQLEEHVIREGLGVL